MNSRVLVIDDEPSILRSLARALSDRGHDVETAPTAAEGRVRLCAVRPHVVLLDLKLPDGSGLDLIQEIRQLDATIQVIVLTAFDDTKTAVRAIKLGAIEYLKKPYDLEELFAAVENAARSFSREAELDVYRRSDRERNGRNEMVGSSAGMRAVLDLVEKVARSDAASVLITGESGTGKELVARAIHFESTRRQAPFLEVNCSSFQESLLENELFGHERGAFTGASQLKRGLVELAEGGTLFLDEVGDMPLSTQAKLLRFLEARSFRRVGGNLDLEVDLRVLAATNVDLEERMANNSFRLDLFHRLQVVQIHLPPLRERGDDIGVIATSFLRRFALEMKKGFRSLSPEVEEVFRRYDWPGNVRELRNLMERVVLIEDGDQVEIAHLPRELLQRLGVGRVAARGEASSPVSSMRTLRDVEDEYICSILVRCDGNKSQAARVLGLSRQGLLDRLKRVSLSGSALAS